MSKHTPGPWKIEDFSDPNNIDILAKGEERFVLAEVICPPMLDWMPSRAECQANAALIAAAPQTYQDNIELRARITALRAAISDASFRLTYADDWNTNTMIVKSRHILAEAVNQDNAQATQ